MNTTDLLAYASFALALISVITVVLTLRQNSKMIEASTRPVICIYSDEINSGAPQGFLCDQELRRIFSNNRRIQF